MSSGSGRTTSPKSSKKRKQSVSESEIVSHHEAPSQAPRKITFFVGAPTVADLLSRPLVSEDELETNDSQLSSSSSLPSWRVVHLKPKRLKSGFTQNSYYSTPETAVAAESEGSATVTDAVSRPDISVSFEDEDSEPATGPESQFTLEPTTTLNNTTTIAALESQRPPIPALTSLTDLEDLPSPSELPHPSISALVTVLDITPPRTVTTRYSRPLQLVEITVGDPTYQHFPISVWLQPTPSNMAETELKAVVEDLRVMDVVVVRDVQLGVFDGRVVGRMGRGSEMWIVERLKTMGKQERKGWKRKWDTGLAGRKVKEHVEWSLEFMDGGASFLERSAFWPTQ